MTEIELPWPPPQLMPNFKRSHHWSAYRKQEKAARMLGWGMTAQAIGPKLRAWECPEGGLAITIEATPPMRPGPLPDADNFTGAMKHYLDGIASALAINDRHFRLGAIQWQPKEGAGKVVISF